MNETMLVEELGPLFSGRFFPDSAPFDTPKPYCTWQLVGGKPINLWGGGATDLTFSRIQFIVWSTTALEAIALIRQVENKCKSDPLFGVSEGGAVGRYESPNLRGQMQDFTFGVRL